MTAGECNGQSQLGNIQVNLFSQLYRSTGTTHVSNRHMVEIGLSFLWNSPMAPKVKKTRQPSLLPRPQL